MTTSQKALALIKHFESLHDGDLKAIGLQPKLDPIGIWTVGYGYALRDPKTGTFLKGAPSKELAYRLYPCLTEEMASIMLLDQLKATYEPEVLKMLGTTKLNDDQFGACVSFAYNCGTHYKNSGGVKMPYALWGNIRADMHVKNPVAFRAYWDSSVIKAGGKVLSGLIRRRKAEAHLFLTGTLKFDF